MLSRESKEAKMMENRIKRKEREILKATSLLLGLSLVILSTHYVGLAEAWPTTRYYAGYWYGDDAYARGTSGSIYTINPSVPSNNFYCQWHSVVISYTYGYWVQLGYNKNSTTNVNKIYIEVLDSGTPARHVYWYGTPSAGSTHNYLIWRNTGQSSWTCTEDSTNLRTVTPSPYMPVDLQSMSESTTDTGLSINGTHFSYLSFYTGSDWWLWDVAYADPDPCYTMTYDQYYEFHASGGA